MKADRKYAKEFMFNLADCDFYYIVILSDIQTKQLVNKTQNSKSNKTLFGQRKRTLSHSFLICTNSQLKKKQFKEKNKKRNKIEEV